MFIASRLSTFVRTINPYQLLSTSARIINLYNVRRTIYVPPGLTADLEVGVLLAEDVGDPEAADIVAQGLGRDQTEAVLFGYVVEFYCCTHSLKIFCFYFFM